MRVRDLAPRVKLVEKLLTAAGSPSQDVACHAQRAHHPEVQVSGHPRHPRRVEPRRVGRTFAIRARSTSTRADLEPSGGNRLVVSSRTPRPHLRLQGVVTPPGVLLEPSSALERDPTLPPPVPRVAAAAGVRHRRHAVVDVQSADHFAHRRVHRLRRRGRELHRLARGSTTPPRRFASLSRHASRVARRRCHTKRRAGSVGGETSRREVSLAVKGSFGVDVGPRPSPRYSTSTYGAAWRSRRRALVAAA